MPLASYKLRFDEGRIRAVPLRASVGDDAPFTGPGVDLRGEEASEVLAAAAPVRAWLLAREPGVVLRSVSVDHRAQRVLVTLEATPRPRVVRIDGAAAIDLLATARELEERLGRACARALARRAQGSSGPASR